MSEPVVLRQDIAEQARQAAARMHAGETVVHPYADGSAAAREFEIALRRYLCELQGQASA